MDAVRKELCRNTALLCRNLALQKHRVTMAEVGRTSGSIYLKQSHPEKGAQYHIQVDLEISEEKTPHILGNLCQHCHLHSTEVLPNV